VLSFSIVFILDTMVLLKRFDKTSIREKVMAVKGPLLTGFSSFLRGAGKAGAKKHGRGKPCHFHDTA